MRFRVTHLLAAVVVVAVCATALVNPRSSVSSWMWFFAWLFYLVLLTRALAKSGRERLILVCALVAGLSHFAMAYWLSYSLPLAGLLQMWLEGVIPLQTGDDYYHFNIISELCVSFLMSLVGGILGAFWTQRSGTNPD